MKMLCIIYLLISALLVLGIYLKSSYAICRSKRRLEGKTALVTGGTAGMGLQTAKDFANRGARVIIACPFEKEGVKARKYIIQKTGNNEVIFKLLDLSSLASVRNFTNEVINEEGRLDILVNNAGVCLANEYITEDQLSFTMQVNYFGHFLLTLLLLPLLKKTGKISDPSRIVNVTSLTHLIGKTNFEKINGNNHWALFQIYANSKLCMILFTRELSKKLEGSKYVVVNSADPGIAATFIVKPNSSVLKSVVNFSMIALRAIMKTPWQGAQTAIHVAIDSNAEGVSGEMFCNCKLSKASKIAYDDDVRQNVWDESVRLVKLNSKEVHRCFE